MRDWMARLAGMLARRRWWVALAWLVVVIAAVPFAARQTDHLTGAGFDVPGSESKAVSDAVAEDFPGKTFGIGVVLQSSPGSTAQEDRAALARVRHAVAAVDDVSLSPAAAKKGEAELARDHLTLIPLYSTESPDALTDVAGDLRSTLHPGSESDGVTPYLVGQPAAWAGLQDLTKQDLAQAEESGFPVVALILLVVFGSLAAAALPLALGFASVLVTGALIYLISLQMEMSVFVTNMASMIGIGVAVDYSLFILARFREEVRAGRGAAEARAEALSTSGLAVVFSGTAVIISLAGLWMVDNQALRSMALGAMIVVAISILAAVVLLPALIRVLGHRVEAGGVVWSVMLFLRRVIIDRRRRPGRTRGDAPTFWQRWTTRVMARPWLSVLGVSAVMLTLAIPVLSMETSTGALDQFPSDHDVVVGANLAAKETGGAADPIEIVATFNRGDVQSSQNRAAVTQLQDELRRDPAIGSVAAPIPGPGTVLIQTTPKGSNESDATQSLVERLRTETVPRSRLAQVATVDVGGQAARITDVTDQINGSMWKIIAFILGLSFLVLLVMLRSVVLPLKAILMNLLSIGAAYGVLVAVFQWGWADGFLGFQSPGAIDTLNPPLILAVVFGLSMDYEVFLLSRIRERYEAHGDNRRAVAEGLASSARTISSAALIMTAVFSVFVLTGVPSIKELGLGNAVAIALDATLVRLILVPAAMQLMGRWNWWLPGWLDRILPDVGFERRRGVIEAPRGPEAPSEA
jgi:uncharacterized membrane protein YdfJ with MMPL/SSD domain